MIWKHMERQTDINLNNKKALQLIRELSDSSEELSNLWPQRSTWPWPWPRVWPQKVTGSLEVAVTYFMTPKVTVTFVVGLT